MGYSSHGSSFPAGQRPSSHASSINRYTAGKLCFATPHSASLEQPTRLEQTLLNSVRVIPALEANSMSIAQARENVQDKMIAIVVPVDASTIATPRTINDIRSVMRTTRAPWKIVLVRNGPIKRHLGEYLDAICFSEASIHCVNLAAPVSNRLAIQAGLEAVEADAYITIAADGSEDPRTITEFLRKWRKGSDCVLAVRDTEAERSRFRQALRAGYRMVGRRCSVPVVYNAANFCLMDQKVVSALRTQPCDNRTLAQQTARLGFRRSIVGMERTWHRPPSLKLRAQNHFNTLREALLSHSRTPVRGLYLSALSVIACAVVGIASATVALFAGASAATVTAYLAMTIVSSLCPLAIGMVVLGEYLYRLVQAGPSAQQFSVVESAVKTCAIKRRPAQEEFNESSILSELNSLRLEVKLPQRTNTPPVLEDATNL